jgi:protein SCO1/2
MIPRSVAAPAPAPLPCAPRVGRASRFAFGILMVVAILTLLRVRDASADGLKATQGTSNETPPELSNVDITEHLGGKLPGDAVFRDTSGKMVRLGSFFDGKRPVAFVFAYHTCPMLCSLVLDAFGRGVKGIAWTVGKEFDVVSISIDPHDTPETATKKRAQVVEKYDRGESTAGWHFLVGDEANIRRVTDAIGFQYHYDERQQQYAHPAAMYLLTPDGKIGRYLYGIEFSPSDIRLGLLEASEGRSISTTEKLLLYCYHYDPQGKKYAIVAMNVMRVGGVATMFLLGGFLALMWMRERKKKRASLELATATSASRATDSEMPATAVPARRRHSP